MAKKDLPLLAARNKLIFPSTRAPLLVGRDFSKKAVFMSMRNGNDSHILLFLQKDTEDSPKKKSDLHNVGMLCKIIKFEPIPGKDAYKLILTGVQRVALKSLKSKGAADDSYLVGEYENLPEVNFDVKINHNRALSDLFVNSLVYIIDKGFSFDSLLNVNDLNKPLVIAYMFLAKAQEAIDNQKILQMDKGHLILEHAYKLVQKEKNIIDLKENIADQAREQMSKSQKEYALKEHLKAIRKELGDDKELEIKEYEAKLKKISSYLSREAHDEIGKQIRRIERSSSEYADISLIKNYLNTIFSLPWFEKTVDCLDIIEVQKSLDKEHYGLQDVKDRILEFLAIRKLNPKSKGPIICFNGPPGTGKTSLAKSIAKALKRKSVSISLGGVKDEAEIRGHRRTYVGSMPGKIINGMKQVKVVNPLIILDEIDKLSHDFRGDPSSALLEVLDPEQNSIFKDHYLNIEYDLSNVMFIATSNNMETIPPALKDRMEIIPITGYCEEEKVKIGKKFLVKRQKKEKGLLTKDISFTEKVLVDVIRNYTREFGVRELERQVGKVCRKVARRKAENDDFKPVKLIPKTLPEFLGTARYDTTNDNVNGLGVVSGLAWTPYGGEVLKIEAGFLKEPGDHVLTGRLGEVMKESAKIAISVIKINAKKWGIDYKIFEKYKLHIHAPSGAVQKEGPSAGVALIACLVSLVSKKKIRNSLAMTGEITLSGKVLPVGGIKEKVLAAARSGIKTVLIPKENQKDYDEIADNLKKGIDVRYLSNVKELLSYLF